MTTTATIPLDEFEAWLEPAEVTAIFVAAGWFTSDARVWLIRRLRDGLIRACAHEILVGQSAFETQHAYQLVTRDAWDSLTTQAQSFWNGGDHEYSMRGGFGVPDQRVRLYAVRICRNEVFQKLPEVVKRQIASRSMSSAVTRAPQSGNLAASPISSRAPAYKAGNPPTSEAILAKADEMRTQTQMTAREIASKMHLEPGFENVATRDVRELLKGRYQRTGRAGIKSAQ